MYTNDCSKLAVPFYSQMSGGSNSNSNESPLMYSWRTVLGYQILNIYHQSANEVLAVRLPEGILACAARFTGSVITTMHRWVNEEVHWCHEYPTNDRCRSRLLGHHPLKSEKDEAADLVLVKPAPDLLERFLEGKQTLLGQNEVIGHGVSKIGYIIHLHCNKKNVISFEEG
jgi:hypothetical protein